MGQYFATVARGLEALAAEELRQLGASDAEPGFCGVGFTGDQALLYRVNLWGRLPFRVLVQLAEFSCDSAEALYDGVRSLDWSDHLTPEYTLAVQATGKTGSLNHSHYSALQVKNAIVDQQRDRWGRRSDVDAVAPDVGVNVHLHQGRCTVSLNSSGDSLHRRGYRAAMGQAPLKESLAAALLMLSHWQPTLPLIDPLCGSGTLPLEAALMALDIAPGLYRSRFGFQEWPDFNLGLWQQLVAEAKQRRHTRLMAPIWGCDRNPEIIEQALANAAACGVDELVEFWPQELDELVAPAATGILICNPPYGHRLGAEEDLTPLYRLLGDVLKQRFSGWSAYILSGNKELSRAIGLKSSQRQSVFNGSLPCQFLRYEIF